MLCRASSSTNQRKENMAMLALIATPTREFVARQKAVLASWTIAERKQRAGVAQIKLQELGQLLSMLLRGKGIGSERQS
jgi:hypothetical protein